MKFVENYRSNRLQMLRIMLLNDLFCLCFELLHSRSSFLSFSSYSRSTIASSSIFSRLVLRFSPLTTS
jgi:hypothetical protein